MAVGIATVLSSLFGLLGAILLTAGFLFRCQAEERMLVQAFGEQ
jgi:protein-S-isoprenylcysteine O-methyltransferase Ste14